jgi:hypothetical protein
MKPISPRRPAPRPAYTTIHTTVFFAAFAVLVPAAASAQTPAKATVAPAKKGFVETRTDAGADVTFDDDQALGDALDPYADIVKARPPAARFNLLRPRTNFVPEMLKSVENM